MKNNKARRNEIKKLKFLRRLRLFRLQKDWEEGNWTFNGYRTTSRPCTCFICKRPRYKRNEAKRETFKLIKEYEENTSVLVTLNYQ